MESPATTDGQQVMSVRRYEAGPPANLQTEVVDPETVATTREEEWVTKKKVELTTTRQIETRVQRQVVLEDGKVVEDSGPIVTTNTTEDTEKQEHKKTEHHTTGDEPPGPNWVAVPGSGVVKEVKEKKVKSREETEERLETEDVQILGDISDVEYLTAVRDNQDVRRAVIERKERPGALVPSGPRVVHQSKKKHKIIDTEDKEELSEVKDGNVITETKTTKEHEEFRTEEVPDDDLHDGRKSGSENEETKESSHRYSHTKDQDFVEYIAVPKGGNLSEGVKVGEEMRFMSENIEGEREGEAQDHEWESLSARLRRMRRQKRGIPATTQANLTAAERKDALTKRPLDFDEEEETRKLETNKWLESHFGSESRSSKDSLEDEEEGVQRTASPMPPVANGINVTMTSRPLTSKVGGSAPTPPPPPPKPSPKAYLATVNSSSRVFLSSPESEASEREARFQGVNEWSERNVRKTEHEYRSFPVRPDRVKVLPTGPGLTFKGAERSHQSSTPLYSPSSPLVKSPQVPNYNGRDANGGAVNGTTPLRRDTEVEYVNHVRQNREDSIQTRYRQGAERTYTAFSGYRSPLTKEPPYRLWERMGTAEEPPPDYPPPPPPEDEPYRGDPSPPPSPPNPSPPPAKEHKKQKTRFAEAVDHKPHKSSHQSASSRIGESFRKLVDKLRPDDKHKRRSPSPRNRTSSPDNAGFTYTNYVSGTSSSANHYYREGRAESPRDFPYEDRRPSSPSGRWVDSRRESSGRESPPVRPPRHRSRHGQSPRADSSIHMQVRRESNTQTRRHSNGMYRQRSSPAVQRFYLGEDPFGGSIYGRESEYDGVVPARSRKQRSHNSSRRGSHDEASTPHKVYATATANIGSTTLGRFSKSSSRIPVEVSPDYYRAQTLPRKLHEDRSTPKKFYFGEESERSRASNSYWESRLKRNQHTGSLINVSIVNHVTPNSTSKPPSSLGPAKPARTYRSSLTRSKSFNVQPEDRNIRSSPSYTSNPHLNKLEDSAPPLKSPGIVTSISRSQRDLSERNEDLYRDDSRGCSTTKYSIKKGNSLMTNGFSSSSPPRAKSPSSPIRLSPMTNGHDEQTTRVRMETAETKKKLFMRGLLDRAPELFMTLHGDEDISDLKNNRSKSPIPPTKPLRSRSPERIRNSPSPSPNRIYTSTPLKNDSKNSYVNGHLLSPNYNSSSSKVNYSNSFRSTTSNDSTSGLRPKIMVTKSLDSSDYSFRNGDVSRVKRSLSPTHSFDINNSSMMKNGGHLIPRGTADDYSETIRISSTSDDPIRPSVTNTVQSFSKKTIPKSNGHAAETVESSEITTVTKSKYREPEIITYPKNNKSVKYYDYGQPTRNGSVVIEVRNDRK